MLNNSRQQSDIYLRDDKQKSPYIPLNKFIMFLYFTAKKPFSFAILTILSREQNCENVTSFCLRQLKIEQLKDWSFFQVSHSLEKTNFFRINLNISRALLTFQRLFHVN
jgi:hypothetical protein